MRGHPREDLHMNYYDAAEQSDTWPPPEPKYRGCLNCMGTGLRAWPRAHRNGRTRERLEPQIVECGACQGTGRIAVTETENN